jgi:hypothetical protein
LSEDDTRVDIVSTVDNFIEKIQDLRKVMLGVSISAVILAPFAIGLATYLLTHPAFYDILEERDEFGAFLGIMLGGIIGISGIWLITGIRQYKSLNNWNHRYCGYLKKKQDLDSKIISEYHLDEDQQT